MAALLSPESDVSQALSIDEREEISKLYLKFVDLYGTIDEMRLAWERHRKLFPHIMKPSSVCDYSPIEFQIKSKKTEGPKDMQTNPPNHSTENPSKNVLTKHPAEIHAPINMPIIPPKVTLMCELKSYNEEDNEKESQKSIAAEAIHILEPSFPGETEIDITNKVDNVSKNVAQIPDALSEYTETEMPVQNYMHTLSLGNPEPPAIDSLSISSKDYVTRQTNAVTSQDNNAHQEATSKESGKKFFGNGDNGNLSVIHSSGEKDLKSCSDSQAKLQEDSSHLHPARPIIKADAQFNLQEKVNTSKALPANPEYPPTVSSGGQWAQSFYGVQGTADQSSMLHGNIQFSNPQQWQAHGPMQYPSGGTSQGAYLTQSYISQTPYLPNSQDAQASHSQLQYHLAASQAYTNPGLSFPGQHMQQLAPARPPDQQVQHASSQNQILAYQNVLQSNDQYGYHQSYQGFSPHIWQYYQNLYYLQQEQLQHRQHDQQMSSSCKQQLTDPSEGRSTQQELLENQEERVQLQVQADTQKHHRNIDEKNTTREQENQQEKQEESTQPNQQSRQVMSSEQSQHLYLRQQQQYYFQQQQHYEMYMQQQHLLQQQQQHQLLLFQQQQLQVQHQHQPKQIQQQQQSMHLQQQHQSLLQPQDYQLQWQKNASELKAIESNAYAQDKGNPPQSAAQSTTSHSSTKSVNSPDR